jgi:hypothetical protein
VTQDAIPPLTSVQNDGVSPSLPSTIFQIDKLKMHLTKYMFQREGLSRFISSLDPIHDGCLVAPSTAGPRHPFAPVTPSAPQQTLPKLTEEYQSITEEELGRMVFGLTIVKNDHTDLGGGGGLSALNLDVPRDLPDLVSSGESSSDESSDDSKNGQGE